MKDFVFYNPTQIVFGEGKTSDIGRYLPKQKCLLLYGSGSIQHNGIYHRVTESLAKYGISFVEKGGVRPNPVISFVREAIAASVGSGNMKEGSHL